jgi:hypothetical protein
MSAVGMLLAAALAAPAPAAPYPRPSQPGYSVAKAFTAIVRRDEEVNIQDLSQAFGLPELLNRAFTWQGPFGGYEEPHFSAYYDPPNSAVGITKIVIDWNAGPLIFLDGKPAVSLSLTIFLRPDACPSKAEMASASGVPMSEGIAPGVDGGPSYPIQWFAMPDGNGHTKNISFSSGLCQLSATYVREN